VSYFRRYRGSAAAAGVVTMLAEPDYSGGADKFVAWLATMNVKRFDLQVEALAGSVSLEGCNGRPSVADEWFVLGTISADGRIVVVDQQVDFVRVNKTVHTSGTAVCMLTLGG
jgi:hypothetical protein